MLDRDLEVLETVLFKETGLPKGGLNQRLRGGLAVLGQQTLVERPGVDSDSDRASGVGGSPGNLLHLIIEGADVARIDAYGSTTGIDRRKDVAEAGSEYRRSPGSGTSWR